MSDLDEDQRGFIAAVNEDFRNRPRPNMDGNHRASSFAKMMIHMFRSSARH
jgi:hypothetical protein